MFPNIEHNTYPRAKVALPLHELMDNLLSIGDNYLYMGSPRKFKRPSLITVLKTQERSVYGRLTTVRFYEKRKSRFMWLCKCECGKEKIACEVDLRIGDTKSCGCLKNDGSIRKTHGERNTYLYWTWSTIKSRVLCLTCHAYGDYGGRGILIYAEWINSFVSFRNYIKDNIGDRPSIKHTIDRINNDGNYEPVI